MTRGAGPSRPPLSVACVIDPGKLWNPYLRLLQQSLGDEGVRYRSGIGVLWRGDYRLVHVHWPEAMARHRFAVVALAKAVLMIGGLVAARLRGRKVVWTVHNLQTHEGAARPWLEGPAWRLFERTVSGVILLAAGSESEFVSRYPRLADRPRAIIPHGHYRALTGAGAKRRPPGKGVATITFPGLVRPYKGVRELIDAFSEAGIPDCRLVIAGQAMGGPAEPDFPRVIERMIAADPRITGHLRRLSDEELTELMAETDLAVTPFRRVLNSGSVLFALSCDRPVCAPRLGAMAEIQASVGPEWLYLYDPPLTPAVLEAALRWALDGKRGARPDLDAFDWPAIARAHRAFFESLQAPAARDGPA
ncbi:MAG: glycosyltransferase [Pseudomonadota bacterium]